MPHFLNQRQRFAACQRRPYPVGSGAGEAVWKTLVTQRLEDLGVAWVITGGRVILILRSFLRGGSERTWPVRAADCCSPAMIPGDNVEVPLP